MLLNQKLQPQHQAIYAIAWVQKVLFIKALLNKVIISFN